MVLVQYVGNLHSAAFHARALEGANRARLEGLPSDGIIVTGRGGMFLYGTGGAVNEMIAEFPEDQSRWKADANSAGRVRDGIDMQEAIIADRIGKSETFRSMYRISFRNTFRSSTCPAFLLG
jgi:hypothetical protein